MANRNRIFAHQYLFDQTATILICFALIGIGPFAFWWNHSRPVRLLNAFWKPILETGSSTLVCVGDLNYLMKDECGKKSGVTRLEA